jgi:hypothetical protein
MIDQGGLTAFEEGESAFVFPFWFYVLVSFVVFAMLYGKAKSRKRKGEKEHHQEGDESEH